MSSARNDADKEELEQRIEQLERHVQKMMPNRRQVLAGGAAALGAGVVGYNSGKAEAAGLGDGDTQWGSTSNRDDYVVDHVDANSVSTDQLNNDIRFADASVSEIQSGFDAMGRGEVLVSTGSLTIDTTLELDQVGAYWIHYGPVSLNADGVVLGRNSTANYSHVTFNGSVTDGSQTYTPFIVEDGYGGTVTFNDFVKDCEKLAYIHALNGTVGQWEIFMNTRGRGFVKGVDIHAENHPAEGVNLWSGAFFDTEKTIHIRGSGSDGTAPVGTGIVFGTTLHGSTASKNTHEILEEGNAKQMLYLPEYLGHPNFHSVTGTGDVAFGGPSSNAYYLGEWMNGLTINEQTAINAGLGSNTSLTAGSFKRVPFDTVVVDERGEFDTSTNEAVVDRSGKYEIHATVTFSSVSDQDLLTADLRVNGTSVSFDSTGASGGGNQHSVETHSLESLSAGDSITVSARDNDSNASVVGVPERTNLTISRIA